MIRRLLAHVLLLTVIGGNAVAQKKSVDVLIKSGSLIDVPSGKVLTKKLIAIRGNTIVGVFDERQARTIRAKNVIDADSITA